MKIVKASAQRALDEQAKHMGIAGILFMEHAAQAVKKHLDERYGKRSQVVIVCGPGNNGGDGFALARLCFQDELYRVQILCHSAETQRSADVRSYALIAKNLGIPWYRGTCMEKITECLEEADVIVDALYGTGLTRPIEGIDVDIIKAINASRADVVAVDIPSGLGADSGELAGCAVVANTTISFVFGKLGLFIKEGITHSGEVIVCDIGMPHCLQDPLTGMDVLDNTLCRAMLPIRKQDAHKGSYGKALLVGGSRRMRGAMFLAGKAALRCGLGTLSMLVPKSIGIDGSRELNEAMYIELEENNGEFGDEVSFEQWCDYDVIAIGNGMGRGIGGKALLKQVLESDRPCILDGDALYDLKDNPELLKRNAITVILPHPKELSYILGIYVRDIVKNPAEALYRFEKAYPNVCIVMKNARTIISSQQQRLLNIIGNDGLATGGSGDVLCGMVLAFLGQSKDPLASCGAAVYLHALCADELRSQMSTYSILPQDILKILPITLKNVIEN